MSTPSNPIQPISIPSTEPSTPLKLVSGANTVTTSTGEQIPLDVGSGTFTSDPRYTPATSESIGLLDSINNLSSQLNTGSTGSNSIVNPGSNRATAVTSAAASSASSKKPAKKREIPCPYCGGGKKKQITNDVPKVAKSAQSSSRFCGTTPLQKVSEFLGDVLESIANILKIGDSQNRTKTVQEILGTCPKCGNKNVIEDPTDRSEQEAQAAQKIEAAQKQILDTEAKMGPPGGNDVKVVVGDKHLEVGLGHNDTPSYAILPDTGMALGGGKITKDGVVADYEKVNTVVGTNPLATTGGKYSIKCSNSFKVRAGAQGIELNTEGPLIIKAGQTQLVAPEVTIGSSKGQVAIEGNNLSLAGKNVAINAGAEGNGQVSFGGTVFATGNIVAQGGAHIEGDISCNSMTIPGKVARSQVSSQDTQVTGAAVWQTDATTQALKNFLRVRQIRGKNNPTGMALTEREKQNTAAEQKNLLKMNLPIEERPCGFANLTTGEVFLFPHHHTLDDMVHAHDSVVPNINIAPDSQTIRQSVASTKILPAPAPANINVSSVFESIKTTFANLPIVKQIIND